MERQFEPEASFDGAILDDDRLLHNLIMAEEHYLITSSYFKCLQTDLKPGMRDVVANWMLEVTSITTTLPTAVHYYSLVISFAMLKHTSAFVKHIFTPSSLAFVCYTTFARLFPHCALCCTITRCH